MTKYVAILRGINVGGKRIILMKDLVKLFESLKYYNVSTYIQSGNVFFESEDDLEESIISKSIEIAIFENYGFDVPVIIRTKDDLQKILLSNPFVFADPNVAASCLHLTFLSGKPTDEQLLEMTKHDFSPDLFQISGRDVYIYCSGKYHETKLSNQFFEKKLKLSATTRNWQTVLKLAELMIA